jgi:hypothetical protein
MSVVGSGGPETLQVEASGGAQGISLAGFNAT